MRVWSVHIKETGTLLAIARNVEAAEEYAAEVPGSVVYPSAMPDVFELDDPQLFEVDDETDFSRPVYRVVTSDGRALGRASVPDVEFEWVELSSGYAWPEDAAIEMSERFGGSLELVDSW